MRSLKVFIAIIALLGIGACTHGQVRKSVYGDKNVVTREREADYFSGLKVSSGVDVYLKQGESEAISVEADENLHEYILTEIKDGTLNVYTDANIRSAERKRVYVTMKEISSIRVSSAGDVIGQTPVKTEDLRLSASSAGDIKLEVYTGELEVNISSSGDITLSGEADDMKAQLSSAGDLNAFNLKVREAEVSASSAGDADLNVTEKLTARASSAGDINYMGNPKFINTHSSSAGGIHKR